MKERPILMSTAIVKSTLAGIKTNTRRIIKGHPANMDPTDEDWHGMHHAFMKYSTEEKPRDLLPAEWMVLNDDNDIQHILGKCPYGDPGDIIWVKELHYAWGWWIKEGLTKSGKQKWRFVDFTGMDKGGKYHYSDNAPADIVTKRTEHVMGWHKRNSLFMPKEAARIWLQVVSVGIERLQDISEADALAEGINWNDPVRFSHPTMGMTTSPGSAWIEVGEKLIQGQTAKDVFNQLWDVINGAGSGDTNPWLWVILFKVLSTTGRPT